MSNYIYFTDEICQVKTIFDTYNIPYNDPKNKLGKLVKKPTVDAFARLAPESLQVVKLTGSDKSDKVYLKPGIILTNDLPFIIPLRKGTGEKIYLGDSLADIQWVYVNKLGVDTLLSDKHYSRYGILKKWYLNALEANKISNSKEVLKFKTYTDLNENEITNIIINKDLYNCIDNKSLYFTNNYYQIQSIFIKFPHLTPNLTGLNKLLKNRNPAVIATMCRTFQYISFDDINEIKDLPIIMSIPVGTVANEVNQYVYLYPEEIEIIKTMNSDQIRSHIMKQFRKYADEDNYYKTFHYKDGDQSCLLGNRVCSSEYSINESN